MHRAVTVWKELTKLAGCVTTTKKGRLCYFPRENPECWRGVLFRLGSNPGDNQRIRPRLRPPGERKVNCPRLNPQTLLPFPGGTGKRPGGGGGGGGTQVQNGYPLPNGQKEVVNHKI